ncbi:MAG: hypothetical protein D6800_02330 [Candidatus Zixiibacteriota bacterium]|nr:MAG: hypothetical protein D6800_02330 [candidate division Zixibacteria bacterium]
MPPKPAKRRSVTYPTIEAWRQDVLAALQAAREEPVRYDSPAFGPMSDDERRQLNLRHGELHMSFLESGNRSEA